MPFLSFFAAMISSKSIWAKEKSTKLWNMAKMAKTVHFITPMVYVHGILLLWLKLPQKLWLPEMWISLPLPLQLLVKWFKIQCLSFKYNCFNVLFQCTMLLCVKESVCTNINKFTFEKGTNYCEIFFCGDTWKHLLIGKDWLSH